MIADIMIIIKHDVFKAMQDFAEYNHPNEIILLLRGKREKDDIIITDFLLPPFGFGGRAFASFPSHMLPIDLTIMGTVHSHPSGVLSPSVGDMHNFYGRVMIIIGPPYNSPHIAAYNKNGDRFKVTISNHQL